MVSQSQEASDLIMILSVVGVLSLIFFIAYIMEENREVSCLNKDCDTRLRIKTIKKQKNTLSDEAFPSSEGYYYEAFCRVWYCPNCQRKILIERV